MCRMIWIILVCMWAVSVAQGQQPVDKQQRRLGELEIEFNNEFDAQRFDNTTVRYQTDGGTWIVSPTYTPPINWRFEIFALSHVPPQLFMTHVDIAYPPDSVPVRRLIDLPKEVKVKVLVTEDNAALFPFKAEGLLKPEVKGAIGDGDDDPYWAVVDNQGARVHLELNEPGIADDFILHEAPQGAPLRVEVRQGDPALEYRIRIKWAPENPAGALQSEEDRKLGDVPVSGVPGAFAVLSPKGSVVGKVRIVGEAFEWKQGEGAWIAGKKALDGDILATIAKIIIADVVRAPGLPCSIAPGTEKIVAVTFSPGMAGTAVTFSITGGPGTGTATIEGNNVLNNNGEITIKGGDQTQFPVGLKIVAKVGDQEVGNGRPFAVCTHPVAVKLMDNHVVLNGVILIRGKKMDLVGMRTFLQVLYDNEEADKTSTWISEVVQMAANDGIMAGKDSDPIVGHFVRGKQNLLMQDTIAWKREIVLDMLNQDPLPIGNGTETTNQQLCFYCERCGMMEGDAVGVPESGLRHILLVRIFGGENPKATFLVNHDPIDGINVRGYGPVAKARGSFQILEEPIVVNKP